MNLKNLIAKSSALLFVFLLFAGSSFAQTTYYVDGVFGNNTWTGTSPNFVSGNVGPKASIDAMVQDVNVVNLDIIRIASGTYNETVTLGKRVELLATYPGVGSGDGNVVLLNLILNTGSATATQIK